MKKTRGFTLIELVLVIAILGILAVAALPSLFNISLTQAKTNAMNATVASIQTGLSLLAANQVATNTTIAYPTSLDTVATYPGIATGLAPLFGGVLQTPISANWIKKSATCYVYDNDQSATINTGDLYFQYTGGTTGTFLQTTSGACT
jgi:prepilin-type N-terminal cleavage/methylation domain-containing protein